MENNPNMSIHNEDFERVELFLSCRSLNARGKEICLRVSRVLANGGLHTIKTTEKVPNNPNPDFSESIEIDFVFEKEQVLMVECWDIKGNGQQLGTATFSLAEVVGSQYNLKILTLTQDNSETGKCIVRVDQMTAQKKYRVNMRFKVSGVPKAGAFASLNTFVKIYKRRLTKAQKLKREENDLKYEEIPASEWLMVYKTTNIPNTNDPFFPLVDIKGSKLCDNNFNLPLKFEIMKYKKNGSHYVIGRAFCNLNDLMIPNKTLNVSMVKPKKGNMNVKFTVFSQQEVFHFLDYLEGGLNIVQLVGVDFTGSNRDPEDPESLHHITPHSLNDYQKSILSVGEILEKYNHNRLIPCYGFGAKYPGDPSARHLIPLTGDLTQPCFRSFNDLFQGYKKIVNEIIFSGPTHFAPLLTEVISYARRNYEVSPFNYSIFLLLTDGEIQDMPETIDCIVEGSFLPLSIVIVGIGNEDFSNMEILDGDEKGLVDSNGRVWMRDIVQFVPFSQFKGDAILLREQVLEEIPDQVTGFYKSIGLKPQINQFTLNGVGLINPAMNQF
jgi:hypothetical protein